MFSFNIYKGNYKLLIILPLLLILASLYYIPQIKFGVDFTGGTLVSLGLTKSVDASQLEGALAKEGLNAHVRVFDTAVGPMAEIELPQSESLIKAENLKSEFSSKLSEASYLEVAANQNVSHMAQYLEKRTELNKLADEMFLLSKTVGAKSASASEFANLNSLQKEFFTSYSSVYSGYQKSVSSAIDKHVSYSSISIQTVSPVLSTHFLEKALWVVGVAALLSVIFVFILFRVVVPSIAVLTGALSDVVIAMGAMGLFGIPLTLPSFAALLMLIGFSLDTDILLTMRMLRRKGDPREKAFDAMKTGMTMSIAAIVAFSALFILSSLTNISTYYEISAVALAGLVGDLFATWGINGVMLLWYVERNENVVQANE
ncbi:TPA: hypothetical protein HA238_05350 [Candidatus Micrarchaeota archaeon]|nr:hypothetical protein [Candidatus Micrarchaeota archaeon]